MSMLELRGVSKVYGQGAAEVHALSHVDLSVEEGEMVAVMGPSGSGKTTLLTIAGSLEEPTSGEVLVDGAALSRMSRNAKAGLRRREIGYVFQDFNLLAGLTAAENVALPLELDGVAAKTARAAALRALEGLGVNGRASRFPDELSGGERQRVAIARAVVGERRLLLADEPSGALDSVNAEDVMRLLRDACKRGVTAVVVTHDAQLASWADRVVFLRDGRVADQTSPPPGPESLLAGPGAEPVSTALRGRPIRPRAVGGGVAARRAVIRWAWRLFRREWRQQMLVVGLVTVAVAATILATAIAYNAPSTATVAAFGTADAVLTLPGSDRDLAGDVAAARRRFGPIDVIENQAIAVPGSLSSIELRAQDPHGRYGRPMLSLVVGRYPAGRDEVAVTSGVASLLDLRMGDHWSQGGHARRVTGLVEDPANLLDEFALVAPGQVSRPSQVTLLFDAAAGSIAGLHFAGGATPKRRGPAGDRGKAILHRITPATIVLVVAVLGLILIGLMAVTGFAVMAQRRLRALGMLGALGATDRHIRLVMVTDGLAVGCIGTLIGAAVGFLAWIAYAPRLQSTVEHRVAWSNLAWWAIAIAIALAVVTATAASWRPARAAARVPVVAALSGRPASPRASRRSAAPGILLLAAGLGCLASAGGWTGVGGAVATALGALLLAPIAVGVPAVVSRRAPVAVRLALRDLGRYRARSGPALAAITFVVLLAVLTSVLASARSSSPLTLDGPNLSSNQLIVYEPHGPGSGYTGAGPQPTPAARHALEAKVTSLARSFHARFVVALDSAGRPQPTPCLSSAASCFGPVPPIRTGLATNQRATLWQATSTGMLTRVEAARKDKANYQGALYVATPTLLRDYGIKPAEIERDTDIITSRRGLGAVPDLDLLGPGDISQRATRDGHVLAESYHCTPARCIRGPKIQTFGSLPSGTSAPNTLIAERAVHVLHEHLVPNGWLIQTARPLTPAQKNAARQLALAAETRIETPNGKPDLATIRAWATAASIILALAVLGLTVNLIRSEAASDLRILTAAGASSTIRRTLAGATAGTLGLLGALLGTTVAYIGLIAWAHNSLATLGPAPVAELLAILAGLPLTATISGWVLAGREPRAIARQPLE
jgi:putative ABC transport system permease protein